MFLASSKRDYERSHIKLFKQPDVLTCDQGGRFSAGGGKDGLWTYLIWANTPKSLVHEICHVVLHVFERCGMDPRECQGEPFCYMVSQILWDCNFKLR
jgi:hypothetical protein